MLKPEDISQIKARGSQPETVLQQIENFKTGFPFLKITEAASNYHGIIKLSESEFKKYISVVDEEVSNGLELVKFVPASGAASRMFNSLFTALEKLKKGAKSTEITDNIEYQQFINQLNQFTFYDDLEKWAAVKNIPVRQIPSQKLIEWLLFEPGLNYANLPKALLKFHQYQDGSRTPLEEHLIEGALYSKDRQGMVRVHFTVSAEHQHAFESAVNSLRDSYEQRFEANLRLTFSQQKPSTDTIAVNPNNTPFRNTDGSLLFRPSGHGALLENLNEVDADLIFVKNIDNVVPDQLKNVTVEYKKALAGVATTLQEQIFYYQRMLKEHYPSSLESAFYAEAANFLENVLNITPPANQYYSEKEELFHYFSQKFNRPIRVCGMVKNLGEPGGGPFFVQNRDGSVSLQIVENAQINFNDPEQSEITRQSSHFNPVDLVCAVKDYTGKKYNLLEFRDPSTGLIAFKSKDGKPLKTQELPGLWNGSMADWNTLFIEVPTETFAPVKTLTDLLRKEHQPK